MGSQTRLIPTYQKTSSSMGAGLNGILGLTEATYGDTQAAFKVFRNTYAESTFSFDLSGVPASAEIVSVICKFRTQRTDNALIASLTATLSRTDISEKAQIDIDSTEAKAYTVRLETASATVEDLKKIRLQFYGTISESQTSLTLMQVNYVELIAVTTTDRLHYKANGVWRAAEGGNLAWQ